MRIAFVTGITGQDGSYLAELLLAKGYVVHGVVRRASSDNTGRIAHLRGPLLHLHYGDVLDASRMHALVAAIRPDEIYNLAAQSDVRLSFDEPVYTADVAALGALRLLECVRALAASKPVRFYQASTSEIFGRVVETPQRETTPLRPRSPYACAKSYALLQTINYREAYGLHASNGILFNHESPRRCEDFVTRKITRGLARILAGKQQRLHLGNLEARRDWGFARDYVEAMWAMLQQDDPDDYVIATGRAWSVREFLDRAFACVGLDWHEFVIIDERFIRLTEVDLLLGDSTRARERLGWRPRVDFDELVRLMVYADLRAEGLADRCLHPPGAELLADA